MQYDNCDWRLGQEWPVLYSDRKMGKNVADDNSLRQKCT